jgi:hypothetical protein
VVHIPHYIDIYLPTRLKLSLDERIACSACVGLAPPHATQVQLHTRSLSLSPKQVGSSYCARQYNGRVSNPKHLDLPANSMRDGRGQPRIAICRFELQATRRHATGSPPCRLQAYEAYFKVDKNKL